MSRLKNGNGKTVLDILLKYWVILVAIVAGIVGFTRLEARVSETEEDIDIIETVNTRLMKIEKEVGMLCAAEFGPDQCRDG